MDHYTWQKITERIYLIVGTYGPHHNVMQLLLGDGEAAIIDTGMGATGNLRQLTESITSLPVTCFITHMHPDHAGASMLFDRRYMNPADDIHCWWALTKEKRMSDLEDVFEAEPALRDQAAAEMTDNTAFTYLPMRAGDIFDLGGATLEVLPAEGHTEGSVVLYCKEENALFAGDALGPKIVLVGENRPSYTPLETAYSMMLSISQKTDANTKVFCGHAVKALPSSIIDDALTAFRNVLDGRPSKELPDAKFVCEEEGRRNYRETAGGTALIYSESSL